MRGGRGPVSSGGGAKAGGNGGPSEEKLPGAPAAAAARGGRKRGGGGRPRDAQKELEVRELLIDELRGDIVGPRGGPEEVLPSSERPLRGYLSGILFPQRSVPDEEDDEGRAGVQAGGDADGDADDPAAAGPAGGTAVASAGLAGPASFGLSCTVLPGTGAVQADIDYGTYVEEGTEGGKSGARRFRRVPHSETIEIPVGDPGSGTVPLGDRPEFEVRYAVRRRRSGAGHALRVFVVNTNVHLGAQMPDVSRCAFQPRITLSAPAGAGAGRARAFVAGRKGPQDGGGRHDPDLLLFDMLFRTKAHISTGHGCAVDWDENEAARHGAVSRLRTTFVPRYDVPHVGPRESDAAYLDMETLHGAGRGGYAALLSPLADDYEEWIASALESRAGGMPADFRAAAARQVGECRSALRRIRRGIEIISSDDAAADAFSFANKAMLLQMSHAKWVRDRAAGGTDAAYEPDRSRHKWHLFQLAFFLLNIESITDRGSPDRETADLLWFPTGGGKTEAYLGMVAFTLAHRRIRRHASNHLRYGTAVIMRYTLRLLTLQQFHRAAALMCACESIRRRDEAKWGDEPFLVGLWVGYSTTPNSLKAAEDSLEKARAGRAPREDNPVQIISCPWCGRTITARDYSVSGVPRQCRVHCPNPYCDFSDRRGETDSGLPVLLVDEDVYRRCPSMVIGTVDKFAQVTWKRQAGALFGRVSKYCQKHGFTDGLDAECGSHSGARTLQLGESGLDPPELVIQDELHLISGPLGTLTGIYETAIDALCTGEGRARPKIVASTATAKKAPAQMRSVFDRQESRVFPPQGFDFGESFFATTEPPSKRPGKAYVGVCITSRSGPTVLGRLSAAVLRKVRALEERASAGAPDAPYSLADLDAYHTLVAYFNTIRDLGGANKMYDDTVPRLIQRIYTNFEQGAESGGGGGGPAYKDALLEKRELTSRVDSGAIPDILRSLEARVDGGEGEGGAVDVLMCTNMLSVGVDVSRLGVMIVNGQPKNHSEYIQATGRIGRASPGLVIANLNHFKPRDLSHYEDFVHYHSALHLNVEPIAVTPFSPRSRDRALLGVLVAMMRHSDRRLAGGGGAGKFDMAPPSFAARILGGVRAAIGARAGRVDAGEEDGTLADIDELARAWHGLAAGGAGGRLPLRYSRLPHPKARQEENVEYLMRPTGEDPSRGRMEAPISLRDAEPLVPLWYVDDVPGAGGRGGLAGGEGA